MFLLWAAMVRLAAEILSPYSLQWGFQVQEGYQEMKETIHTEEAGEHQACRGGVDRKHRGGNSMGVSDNRGSWGSDLHV